MIKRILLVLPGLIITVALLSRLYMSYSAARAINEAWLQGRRVGLLVKTEKRDDVVPELVKGNSGRALKMYAAAISLMPADGAVVVADLPVETGFDGLHLDKIKPAAMTMAKKRLKRYDHVFELLEKGAATNYRMVMDGQYLPDANRRLRDIDPLGLEYGSRSFSGHWSLQALLHDRAYVFLSEGSANEAMRQAVIALRLLDYSAAHRRIYAENTRQAFLVNIANTISHIAENHKPSLELCQTALDSLQAVPYWQAMRCAVQGSTYDDFVSLYEKEGQSQLWKPWETMKQANYLQHMASFYEKLKQVEELARKGEPWAAAMEEISANYYVKRVFQDSVSARVALDLAMLRVAQPILNHRTMGAETSVQEIPKELVALRHRTDPWSGTSYKSQEVKGKYRFFSVGKNDRPLYYPRAAE